MRIQKVRFEHFGGIIGTVDPVSLLWVDRDYLLARGFDGRSAWKGDDPGYLSAPVEMEITITSRCNLRCSCCYMEAGVEGKDVPEETILTALNVASDFNLFHVAFGGGEPLLHPSLLFLAQEARSKNLLPALTTNGTLVTDTWALETQDLFARVNVSLDFEDGPRDPRCSSRVSWKAVEILNKAGIVCGVNFILTSRNINLLPRVFEEASRAGADSVLILRPKPSGRGSAVYESLHPCFAQQKSIIPKLLELSEKHNLPFHLDCAFAPLLLTSGVPDEVLRMLGASGCIAGHLLVTVDIAGMVHPCSHLDTRVGPVEKLPELWKNDTAWKGFRGRHLSIQAKCASCSLCELCQGGCAVINQYYGIGLTEPDPDICCQPL